MLIEYLSGEEGGVEEQISAAQISRLIIAGNSLATLTPTGRGESSDLVQGKRPVSLTLFIYHPHVFILYTATIWV